MRVSVISPSFNQAQFLPWNLQSVADQEHGDIEHIVVDPGSADGSREIASRATGVELIAEPDNGQSDAICKGFERSTGEILTWLNSDDFYPSNRVISDVVKQFSTHPEADVIYGGVDFVGESGEFLRKGFVNEDESTLLRSFEYQVGIVQPGVFLRRRAVDAVGGPSDTYEYCMDYEYWVRLATQGFKWHYCGKKLAHHRWWSGMKTSKGRNQSLLEHFRVCRDYFGYVHWKWLDRYAEYLATSADGVVHHAADVSEHDKAVKAREIVDRFVTPDMLRAMSRSDAATQSETLRYIDEHRSSNSQYMFEGSELKLVDEMSSDPDAKDRVAWNVFDARTDDDATYRAYHVPENFDRYFREEWLTEALATGHRTLESLAANRREVCVVVGNGPSLKLNDLALLERADVIVSNFALLSPELARHATILTVVNDLVARQGAVELNASRVAKVVPFWLANSITPTRETAFVSATVRPTFNRALDGEFSWRATVSFFNMQLAYALGYRRVLLIGFDHSYKQPAGVQEGDAIEQKSADENHFDDRYFRGKVWQAADTENMEAMYELAKQAFDADGREIINCSVGGRLEVFRRGDLAGELGQMPDAGPRPAEDRPQRPRSADRPQRSPGEQRAGMSPLATKVDELLVEKRSACAALSDQLAELKTMRGR